MYLLLTFAGNEVTDTLKTGNGPAGLALSHDGKVLSM